MLGHPSDKVLTQIMQKYNQRAFFIFLVMFVRPVNMTNLKNYLSQFLILVPLLLLNLCTQIAPIQYANGHRFYFHFLDDFSGYTWIYPLKHKGEATQAFKLFQANVKNQFYRKIKKLQCDNGAKYKPIISLPQQSAIEIRFTCSYISVQNGRAERKYCHIVEMGLTLIAQARLPLSFWVHTF